MDDNLFVTAAEADERERDNATARTWNGAKSYATTTTMRAGGELVNYFFKALRSTPVETLEKLWTAAKHEDETAAYLLSFFTRDRFKGKGERKPFQEMLKHEVVKGGR